MTYIHSLRENRDNSLQLALGLNSSTRLLATVFFQGKGQAQDVTEVRNPAICHAGL